MKYIAVGTETDKDWLLIGGSADYGKSYIEIKGTYPSWGNSNNTETQNNRTLIYNIKYPYNLSLNITNKGGYGL